MKKPPESVHRSLVDTCNCDVMIFHPPNCSIGHGWIYYECAWIAKAFVSQVRIIDGKGMLPNVPEAAKVLRMAGYKVAISDYEILT